MAMAMTMRAITVPTDKGFSYTNPAQPSDLVLTTIPIPVPTATQYLIKVRSVGISRHELTWEGTYTSGSQPRIPAFDVAGTVVSSPINVDFTAKFKPGDNVFGLLPWDGQGGLADCVVAEEKYLALIPIWNNPDYERRKFEVAASLPRAALTAYQGLTMINPAAFGRILQWGMTIIITGAAGAVGRMAVQIAEDIIGPAGKVIAVAGTWKLEPFGEAFGKSVYAANVGQDDWAKTARKLSPVRDVVFDTIGGQFLERSIPLVKDRGVVLTVASPVPVIDEIEGINAAIKRGVIVNFYIVGESGEQLEQVVDLVQRGVIKPKIDKVVDGLTEEGVRNSWGAHTVVNVSKPGED